MTNIITAFLQNILLTLICGINKYRIATNVLAWYLHELIINITGYKMPKILVAK